MDRHLLIGFLLISAWGLVDFLDGNFLRLGLRDLVWYASGYTYGGEAGLFFRAKSVMLEPGYYSWYLNTIGLMLLGAFASKWWAPLLGTWYLISLTLTVSTTALLLLGVAVGVGALTALIWWINGAWALPALPKLTRRLRGPVAVLGVATGFVLLGWVAGRRVRPVEAEAVETLVTESLSGRLRLEVSSAEDRTVRYRRAIVYFGQAPIFGRGLGDTSAGGDESGLISFFLTLLAEAGLPALLFFLAFLVLLLAPLLRAPPRAELVAPRLAFLMAVVTSAGHYALVTGYNETWPWFLFATTSLRLRRGEV
jgi:O-antigen ligase